VLCARLSVKPEGQLGHHPISALLVSTICVYEFSPQFDSVVTNHHTAEMQRTILSLVAAALFTSRCEAQQAPVFEITHIQSAIKFDVESSISIVGKFDKWNATLKLTSPDLDSGVLDIKIQAASVDTGSGMKNGKLKGKDFFDVANNPEITFHSTKIVQTGPKTFEVDGDFTIKGTTQTEKLTLTVLGRGTGTEEINGIMAFNRKDYGINGSIPFIKIANNVQVTIDLKAKRISGPPVTLKQ
jgi:polyisoprenoid-binding protein YceI